MQETESIHIDAAPEEVWRVLIDVERWPEWTPTMSKVERLDEGPFGPGSRARIKLTGGVPASVWRVTDFREGRGFAWETESGLKVAAEHFAEPDGTGTNVMLKASASGLLATLLTPLMLLTRGNVRKEAEGLKRRVEQGAPEPSPAEA